MIPLPGFSPDSDPTAPGAIIDCQNVVPSEYGLRGAPKPVSAGVNALAAECRGAVNVTVITGSRKLFAGTPEKLYQLNPDNITWSDVSRVGDYTLGADERWSFAQFGDATLAAYPGAFIQRAISGGDFANIAGSPNARVVVAASGFAVAFNTTTFADEWYCSAYLDDQDWTLDVTKQCVKGRLLQGAGQITAAKRLGDDIVAYKAGSMYIGRYQGAPEVWNWAQISGEVGCVGIDAVCETPQGHVFCGRDNVYLCDGSAPRPLATGTIRRWLFREMSGSYMHRTKLLWDRDNHLVWIYFVGGGGTTCTRCVVYHLLANRWGVADEPCQAVVNYITTGVTYDGGTPLVTTYDTSPAIPYDSLFWMAERELPCIFTGANVLSPLAGRCVSASITTGDMGDDEGYTFCDNVRIRYTRAPDTSTITGLVKDESGSFSGFKQTDMAQDGSHHMRQCGRWHRFRLETTGDFHLTAIRPNVKPAGRRGS
jgi:hypothetical protein